MSGRFQPLASLTLALACVGCPAPPPTAEPQAQATPAPPTPAAEPSSAKPQALPEAEAVLERAVAALGGRAALQAVQTYYSKATIEVVGQGLTTVVEIWWQRGDYYMRSDMQGLGVAHLWKQGDAIWADDPVHGKRQLEGEPAKQAAFDAELSLAASWRDHFASAQTVAEHAVDGKARVDVAFAEPGGMALTMSFDPESGLPTAHSMVRDTSLGVVPVITTFDDYREVGGILMPFRSMVSMALYESVLRVETFDVGVPIEPDRLQP